MFVFCFRIGVKGSGEARLSLWKQDMYHDTHTEPKMAQVLPTRPPMLRGSASALLRAQDPHLREL